MDEGEPAEEPPTDTWGALLDAQIRLEQQRTSLRTSVIGIFLAVVLGAVVIRRFVFLTTPERWLLVASPAAVMAAAAVLDHFVLGERVRRLAALARQLETETDRRLERVRREAVDTPAGGLALALFYGLPAAVVLGLATWGLS